MARNRVPFSTTASLWSLSPKARPTSFVISQQHLVFDLPEYKRTRSPVQQIGRQIGRTQLCPGAAHPCSHGAADQDRHALVTWFCSPRCLCSFQIPRSRVCTCPCMYRTRVPCSCTAWSFGYLPFRTSLGKHCLSNSWAELRQRQVVCRKRTYGGGEGKCFPYFHRTEFSFLEIPAASDKQVERCLWNTSGCALKWGMTRHTK